MERRSKRWARKRIRRWLKGQRKRRRTIVRRLVKRRADEALRRQVIGYATLGTQLGALAPSPRGRAWVAMATAAQPVRDRVRWLPLAPTRLGLCWRGHHFS